MARTFFSMEVPYFAFGRDIVLMYEELPLGKVKEILSSGETVIALDPSQWPILKAVNVYLGTQADMSHEPVEVFLDRRDYLVTVQVRGLGQLLESGEYPQEEIEAATFVFGKWFACGTFADMKHEMYKNGPENGRYEMVDVVQNLDAFLGKDSTGSRM